MKRILVTGGAGYVGSHACRALAAAGHVPVVFDDLSRGFRWAVRFGELVEGSLLEPASIDRGLATAAPDAVMHFAALAYVGESVDDPLRYWQTNVVGSANLLAAMQRLGVNRLVFSSTCAVYGNPVSTTLSEDHPFAPISPYGHTKRAVEQLLVDLADTGAVSAVALRYFNAAGAAPEDGLCEAHDPETHLIPLALRAALDPDFSLTLFGDDYDTPDGTCIRDYVHVKDLASAHVAALELAEREPGFHALNIGTGAGHSVREIIQATEAVVGQPVKYTVGARRPGDPPRLVADATRARQMLGWSPIHTDLEATIRDALAGERLRRERQAD
ncbi:MAG: UDP-glucose 4-epimerase GalE [Pseudomonadota bacterium]